MAYRFTGTDPYMRCSVGAFSGYAWRANPSSGAALLKRNSTGTWDGILGSIDDGAGANYNNPMELNPTHQLASDPDTAHPFASTATFNDTTNWMIVGWCWDGTNTAGAWIWRWKIGTGAWSSEGNTAAPSNVGVTIGAGYRMIIGNEGGLADDADFDLVCIGMIKSNLSQGTFESLTMTGIASWDSVFAGSGAWLIGFDASSSRTDRTGNGGNEASRNSVSLVSDPPAFDWGGGAAAAPTLISARSNLQLA